MAYNVSLSVPAEQDMDRMVSYLLLEAQNRLGAERFLAGLSQVVDNLERLSKMYPLASERRVAAAGYRKAVFVSYVAVYRIKGSNVEVARIFHAKQDYARLL